MRTLKIILLFTIPVFFALAAGAQSSEDVYESEEHSFRLVREVGGLENPWSLAYLPDGRLLVTERAGRLNIIDGSEKTEVDGLPEIAATGQGGLLDIALHPDFENNGLIYYTYAARGSGGVGTALGRGRLEGRTLQDAEQLFLMNELSSAGQHFGSRLVFLDDGTLLFTIGDRGQRTRSQNFRDHAGGTIRLNDDGTVPEDNPWVGNDDYAPELFTVGNRNAQGMAIHPRTGQIWQSEHGPRGGDELNLIESGRNYGWPVVSQGTEYSTGAEIGAAERDGMTNPVHYWTPAIAPSGMTFYTGDAFPAWRDNLFLASLVQQQVHRLVIEGEELVHEEVLLSRQIGRIRDIVQGPDGLLRVISDERDGGLYRIEPVH
ncbi:MAG: PQQ-dependent sugar dehydrogenase [Spirochaetaceae bacterium]|nr:MAG: PQQ-dependent sugar dehydrogenase [Spirochaetaceae bacterium]